MSISDEETKELKAHYDHDACDFEYQAVPNEDDVEGSIQMMIDRRHHNAQMEGCEGDFEEGGDIHDESAETEPMDEESCSDFNSMWQTLQRITETLHSKKIAIEALMLRLQGHSHLYKIENLVNQYFSNSFSFIVFRQSRFHANWKISDFASGPQTGCTSCRCV